MQRATLPPREGPRRAAGGQVGTANRQKRRNAHIIYKDQTERGDIRGRTSTYIPPLGLISIGNLGTVSLLAVNCTHLASGGSPRALPGGQRSTLHRDGRSHAVSELAPDGRSDYGDRCNESPRIPKISQKRYNASFPRPIFIWIENTNTHPWNGGFCRGVRRETTHTPY